MMFGLVTRKKAQQAINRVAYAAYQTGLERGIYLGRAMERADHSDISDNAREELEEIVKKERF